MLETVGNSKFNVLERVQSFNVMPEDTKLQLVIGLGLLVIFSLGISFTMIYLFRKRSTLYKLVPISLLIGLTVLTPLSLQLLDRSLPENTYETITSDVENGDIIYKQTDKEKDYYLQRENDLYLINGLSLSKVQDVQVEIKF